MNPNLSEGLESILSEDDFTAFHLRIKAIREEKTDHSYSHLKKDLDQILETRTLERSKYYLRRLIRALRDEKKNPYSDLNLNRWKTYDEILTDSLWIFPERGRESVHRGGYWGNFVPQIPRQLIQRYTKKGDFVLDPFLGSGTTLIECRRLGRNGAGIELQKEVWKKTAELIAGAENPENVQTIALHGDSSDYPIKETLLKSGVSTVQLLILHPPYWDIIRFSEDPRDLSTADTCEAFLSMLGKILDNTSPMLEEGRFMALVIGDKYAGGEWIPLGFLAMQEMLKRDFLLKSIVVKNFNRTKGKRSQEELWRYRALAGGFYVFKHEYVFIFQKKNGLYTK